MQDIKHLDTTNVSYILGLIRDIVNQPSVLDDTNLQTTSTFSSVKIDNLLTALKTDLQNDYKSLIANLNRLKKSVVTTLPTTDIDLDTLYMLKKTDASNNDYFEQYLYLNSTWELVATTSVADGKGIEIYDENKQYVVDDIVIYKGITDTYYSIYICKNATTGTFVDTDWEIIDEQQEFVIVDTSAPSNTKAFWVDITDTTKPVLKFHNGTKWITISGGSSKIDIVKVNGTALPIDSTDNSVNINTYTKTPKWQPNTNYDTIGTEVEYDYKIYSVSTAHTSGTTFEPNNFTFVKYADIDVYSVSQAEYDQLVANGTITDKTRELYYVYDANNNNSNTGNSKGINIWASGEQYEVDNVCIYDDKIYKCKAANSDTDFTPSNWDRISGANVIYVTQTEYDDMKTAGTLSDYDIYIITDGTSSGGSNSVVSPTIAENSENNSDTYKLDITDTNGTFTTPNLKGKDGKSISSIAKDDNNNIIVTFTDGSTQNIGKLSVDIQGDFLTSDGFGNLRYYNGHFQYYDETSSTWIDTSATPDNVVVMNITPNSMKSISAKYNKNTGYFEIKFTEPSDTYIDGQLLCAIEKIVLVRKKDSEPQSIDDGDSVLELKRSNFGIYSKNPYIDKSIIPNIGDIYYYKAFPVSTVGNVNSLTENSKSVEASDYVLYGFKLDQNESDPASMITYLEDCDNTDFSSAYMDYNAGTFNYGDWGNAWFIKNLKPCMLKYDGTVDYELNPNDYSKKLDGTDSDIANDSYEGNAMIGIPKVYWKIVDNGDNTANVYFSDKQVETNFHCWSHIDNNGNEIDYCYMPIYNGSYVDGKLRSLSGKAPMGNQTAATEITYAKSNNTGSDIIWYTELFNDRMLINLLLLLIGKSTDTQTVFGTGNNNSYVSTSNTGIKNTGIMNTKGLFWGNQDNVSGVKVFGMEHWYGNIWRRIAGWINDNGTQKIKLTYGQSDGSTTDGYNTTGSGYISIPGSTPSGTNGGYISKMKFSNNCLIPTIASGSATTYYCDGLWFNNSQVDYAYVGGGSASASLVGAFFLALDDTVAFAVWSVGAALSCKPLASS